VRAASVLIAVAVAGCGVLGTGADVVPARADLTVFGAASLKTALDLVKPAYESAHPGLSLTISTDSSAALETQIEQGAPADVFLAADTTNPDRLAAAGLAEPPIAFAANRLTVVVPASNPAGVKSPADLARSGVKVIAAGDSVPITRYAREAVERLGLLPGYPSDFPARYAANIASKEVNVQGVIARIELDQGDAAIVYATDALAATAVRTIDLPDGANVRATYAGTVIASSPRRETGRAFLAWLAGRDGAAILGRLGFLPPP
jgi:molybdate transport system substrate-binding protein